MRTGFSSHSEVSHIWANEKQLSGKAGNVFFANKTIYSYGYHFPVAKNYDNDYVLLTTKTYSHSTSKHKAIIYRAIPQNKKIVWVSIVDNINDDTIGANFRIIFDGIRGISEQYARARKNKELHAHAILRELENAEKYLIMLDMQGVYFAKENPEIVQKLVDIKNSFENGTLEKAALIQIKKERETAKQARQKLEEQNRVNIELWKNGKNVYLPRNISTFCRIKNNKVDTSQGASITITEAQLIWKMIKAEKPIHGIKVSGYTCLSYDGKILKIGCHSIPVIEVERIGQELNKIV